MTNPNVQNAETSSGNPAYGGQDPAAHKSAQQVDPLNVDPIQDASKDEESVNNPLPNTDKGITG